MEEKEDKQEKVEKEVLYSPLEFLQTVNVGRGTKIVFLRNYKEKDKKPLAKWQKIIEEIV